MTVRPERAQGLGRGLAALIGDVGEETPGTAHHGTRMENAALSMLPWLNWELVAIRV